MKNIKTNDYSKLISVIDNSNYKGESKRLYYTYYGIYSNPIKAIYQLIKATLTSL